MKLFFKKTMLIGLIAALGVASLPLVDVSAAGVYEPPLPQRQVSYDRLEMIWIHQLRLYQKIGDFIVWSNAIVDKVQMLIDRAGAKGKDVTAVQAALDAFEEAIKEAHPVYENGKGIINSHQGFDNDSKVIDVEKAKETVLAMGGKLREIKDAIGGTGRALHEAIKSFREANPRPARNSPSVSERG